MNTITVRDRSITSKSVTTSEPSDAFLSLGIQVRYLRVPTRWERKLITDGAIANRSMAPLTMGDKWEPLADYGCTLYPRVSESLKDGGKLIGQKSDVELNPFKLRTEFLRLDVSDTKSVLRFLTKIGLWNVQGWHWSKRHCDHLLAFAGHRVLDGLAIPTSAADLRREQLRCNQQLDLLSTNPKKLAEQFAPIREAGDALAARDSNTLPLHVEWRHGNPQGVIEATTFAELLRFTLHVNMLNGDKPYVCQRPDCRTRFTGHKRKFCTPECASVMATRALRDRERAKALLDSAS